MPVRIWFVSDVHLYFGGEAYLDQFLEFLDAARTGCDTLYIVGDLFEFWVGDRQGKYEFYRTLFERLESLTASHIAVKIIHGNRDFLMGKIFAKSGVELLPEEVVLDLAGQRVHVSHGDQFCLDDVSYQRARSVFRSRIVKFIADILPGRLGIFLARRYRGISERKKARKKTATGNRFWTIEKGVHAEFERGDHDVILCGHIHYLKDQIIVSGGRERRVLTTGAWEEGPNYIAFDGEQIGLKNFKPSHPVPPGRAG